MGIIGKLTGMRYRYSVYSPQEGKLVQSAETDDGNAAAIFELQTDKFLGWAPSQKIAEKMARRAAVDNPDKPTIMIIHRYGITTVYESAAGSVRVLRKASDYRLSCAGRWAWGKTDWVAI